MSSRKNYSELKKKTYLKYQLHIGNGPTLTLTDKLSYLCFVILFHLILEWFWQSGSLNLPPPLRLVGGVLKAVAITTLCQVDQEIYLFFVWNPSEWIKTSVFCSKPWDSALHISQNKQLKDYRFLLIVSTTRCIMISCLRLAPVHTVDRDSEHHELKWFVMASWAEIRSIVEKGSTCFTDFSTNSNLTKYLLVEQTFEYRVILVFTQKYFASMHKCLPFSKPFTSAVELRLLFCR